MKKLTKKQRREIYLDVLSKLTYGGKLDFLCIMAKTSLESLYGIPMKVSYGYAFDLLPEFALTVNRHDTNAQYGDNNERFICMLLCAEMTKS